MTRHERSRTLKTAFTAAVLGLACLIGAPAAVAQQTLGPDITVGGFDYPGSFLPGQTIPVEIALQCGDYCNEEADWWIWVELSDESILRYDGASGRWVPNAGTVPDAPSFQRALNDLPAASLPGRLLLPPGSALLHFAYDLPMDGEFVVGRDAVWDEDTLWLWVDDGFYEDFSDGRANLFGHDRAGRWSVARERYVLTPGASAAVHLATYRGRFSYFQYGADVRCVGGSPTTLRRGMGIVFNADGDYRNGYVFHINARGYYTIFKKRRGVTVPVVRGWKRSLAIARGFRKWNRLEVRSDGGSLRFWINETLVRTVQDTTFTAGRAGVKAFGGGGDRFEFDNLILRVAGD